MVESPFRLYAGPVIWVSADHIRLVFNSLQMEERLARNEVRRQVIESNRIPRDLYRRLKEPRGTTSQWVEYIETDTNRVVAAVHFYRRPDHSIRGLPDPK